MTWKPKTMLRPLACMGVAALCGAGLVACGSSSSSSSSGGSSKGGVSFTYGYYGNAEELQVYSQLVKLYEKEHPNVHISATYAAAAAFLAKLPIQIHGGDVPDVVNLAESWFAQLNGTFHPFLNLAPYLAKDHLSASQFVKGSWTPGQLDGQQLGLPNIVYGDAVAINKTLFEKDHVPIPTSSWTSSQLLSDAQRLSQGSGKSQTYGIAEPLGPQNVAQLFGGQLFDNTSNKMLTTSPAVQKAIDFEVGLVQKQRVTPPLAVSYNSSAPDPFLTGDSGMDITYVSYDQASFAASIGNKFQWTQVAYPKDMHGVLQENATGIIKGSPNSSSKYAAEAAFVEWLATNPQATKIQGGLSAPAYLSAETSWLKDPPGAFKGANVKQIVSALPRSPFVYDGQQYTQVWTMFGNLLSGMLSGKTSLASGIANIQSQGTSILAR
jgi:multiple sugar transport system substrate-binding protein